MHFNKIITALGLIGFLLYGCADSAKQNNNIPPTNNYITRQAADPVIYSNEADTIHITLVNGKARLKIHKEERSHVNFSFDSQDYTKLNANLNSNDSLANIRFTQIGMPDGNMDGPFDRAINYDLSPPGKYTLFVGENQMAGDPWGGIFHLDIELSR